MTLCVTAWRGQGNNRYSLLLRHNLEPYSGISRYVKLSFSLPWCVRMGTKRASRSSAKVLVLSESNSH